MNLWIQEKAKTALKLLGISKDVTVSVPLPHLREPVRQALLAAGLPATALLPRWRRVPEEHEEPEVGLCMQCPDVLKALAPHTAFVHLPPLIEWVRAGSVPTFRLALRPAEATVRLRTKAEVLAFLMEPRKGTEIIYDSTGTIVQLLVHRPLEGRLFVRPVMEAVELYRQMQDFLLGPRDALPIIGARQVRLGLKHAAQLLGRLDLEAFPSGRDHNGVPSTRQLQWLATHAPWMETDGLLQGQASQLIDALVFRRDTELASVGQMIKILQLGGEVRPQLGAQEASDWVASPPPTAKQEQFLRRQGLWENGLGRYEAGKRIAALTEPKPAISSAKAPWSHTKVLL